MHEQPPKPATGDQQPWTIVYDQRHAAATIKVAVTNAGEVAIFISPVARPHSPPVSEAPESPAATPKPTQEPSPPLAEQTAVISHPGAIQSPSDKPPATASQEQRERPDRIRLVGTIARDPTFRATAKGAYLRFPLAVQGEDKTTWHHVYTTKRFAQRYKDQLQRGQQVEVIGQRQEQRQPRPDGTTRTSVFIYAYAIKPVNEPGDGGSSGETA